MDDRMERLAPLTGVAAVVLWIIGVFIAEGGSVPDNTSTADQILQYFRDETTNILLGSSVFALGTILFLWFTGSLRARLWAAEGGSGRLSALTFAGAIGMTIALLCAQVPQISAAIAVDEAEGVTLSAQAAEALWHAGTGFFVVAEFMGVVFFFALALVALRTGALPKWLAWIGVVLGIIMLIPPIGWAAVIFGMPIWVLIASIWLFRSTASTTTTTGTPPAAPVT